MKNPHNPNTLAHHDLQFALIRTPKQLLALMKKPEWFGKIFIGGGFLRSIVAGDPINDIDVFVSSVADADKLARELIITKQRLKPVTGTEFLPDDEASIKRSIHRTDNALTLTCFKPTVQIIHRWVFNSGDAAANSFDFTCCAAMFWYGTVRIMNDEGQDSAPHWQSYCDSWFYPDVAARRLSYRNPVRNEEAGGSMLRVLKYYQKGYRIPLNSLADVITRLVRGVDLNKVTQKSLFGGLKLDEKQFSKVICGLLREVDPNIDPNHLAHLPSDEDTEDPTND